MSREAPLCWAGYKKHSLTSSHPLQRLSSKIPCVGFQPCQSAGWQLLSLKLGDQIFLHRSLWQVDFKATLRHPNAYLGCTQSVTHALCTHCVPVLAIAALPGGQRGWGWDLWTKLDLLYFVSFWFNPFLSSSPAPHPVFCSLVHPCPPHDKFSYILDKIVFILPWLCHELQRKSITVPAGCGGILAIRAIALAATRATHLQTWEGNPQLVFGKLLAKADKPLCCWRSPTATWLNRSGKSGGSIVEYINWYPFFLWRESYLAGLNISGVAIFYSTITKAEFLADDCVRVIWMPCNMFPYFPLLTEKEKISRILVVGVCLACGWSRFLPSCFSVTWGFQVLLLIKVVTFLIKRIPESNYWLGQ